MNFINKKKLKISIITVNKNGGKFIEKNIKSVLKQTYKNYEHIIVDGLSSDNSVNKIKKNSHKKLKLISEKDRGLYDAMNKGIRNCKGDIIGILNSDDYFYPDALNKIAYYFSKYQKIDFLFGSVKKYKKIYHGYYPEKIYWTFGFYSSHSVGFFIRKKSQHKVGLYNIKYKYSSDYDLFYRMIVKKKMKGMATNKKDLIGFFRSGGISDQIKYIDYLNENTQIRLDNKQNFIIVFIIHYLRFIKRIMRIFIEK